MTTQTIYPALTYTDAPAAIAWLERAFGIVPENVYAGEGGTIAHAQLRAGRDLLMMGTSKPGDAFGNRSPLALGGRGTTALYLRVDDVEERFAKATAAGAKIVRPLARVEYDDSAMFNAEDPEGYVWAFGGYAASTNCDLSACLRYDDAVAALAWMRESAGFTENMVVPNEDGTIAHAEMLLGTSVLMPSSRRDDDLAFDSPRRVPGITGGLYVFEADPDALCERLRFAGTDVVRPLEDMDYGSREFGVRDPEGNIFSYGTYRP